MKILFLGLVVSCFFFTACSSGGSRNYNGYDSSEEDNEPADDIPITSDNWNCTSDCSGHEAGYEWASEKSIEDPDDCGGNSASFIEGCEAYANEQVIESDHDYEDNQYDQSDDPDYDSEY